MNQSFSKILIYIICVAVTASRIPMASAVFEEAKLRSLFYVNQETGTDTLAGYLFSPLEQNLLEHSGVFNKKTTKPPSCNGVLFARLIEKETTETIKYTVNPTTYSPPSNFVWTRAVDVLRDYVIYTEEAAVAGLNNGDPVSTPERFTTRGVLLFRLGLEEYIRSKAKGFRALTTSCQDEYNLFSNEIERFLNDDIGPVINAYFASEQIETQRMFFQALTKYFMTITSSLGAKFAQLQSGYSKMVSSISYLPKKK